jgi:undecaprenyl diphosphate synthase
VAIIMDGNGRWAQQRQLPRIEGHRGGVASVRRVVEEAVRLKLEQITLYCLSSENWKRPQEEVDFLMHLLEQYMIEERATLMQQDIRVSTIGRRDSIPARVLDEIDKTIEMSAGNHGTRLCLAINYGGRAEIVDAIQAIAKQVLEQQLPPDTIDEQLVSDCLNTAGMPDPDLLIRTGGEQRLSNFLLWQVSYAEIWVTEKCWPEFNEHDLQLAIREYGSRVRRFGGLADEALKEDSDG